MVASPMKRDKEQQGKGAITIIEEAVHLLRLSPARLLASYYIGSLPFICGLLYFWADMSRDPFAREYCAPASLGLAILFVWMKCAHAVFARKIWETLGREPAPPWSLGRLLRLVVVQTIVQPSGLLVLPISLLIMFPFGWSYAFYQNISVEGEGRGDNIKTISKRSWDQAKLWPGQNHILLFVFSVFGIFVFLNLAVAIILIPQLLKMLFGVDTLFIMSSSYMLNTTFLAATWGITYLCMDPLIKTVYVLRCFYGSSLRSGYDLKAELKRFLPSGKIVAAILIFTIGTTPFCTLDASQRTPVPLMEDPVSDTSISTEELDHAIHEVLKKRDFAWRIPRERPVDENSAHPGPLAALMDWIIDALVNCVKSVARWIEALVEWLRELLPTNQRSESMSDSGWMSQVRGFLLVLAALVAGLVVIFFLQMKKRRKEGQHVVVGEAKTRTPDLTKEQIRADELPVDGWLVMAKELMAKGSWRLALRAFYLSILANLADHEMIFIAKHKSNRDYERELSRKARDREDIRDLFSRSVRIFDSVWYGMREVNREDLKAFALNQERITAFVEE